MPNIVFREFRDSTTDTNYPFIDTASLTDVDNTLTLPKDLFIDASIYIPGVSGTVYLSRIDVLTGSCKLYVQSIGNGPQGISDIDFNTVDEGQFVVPITANKTRVGSFVFNSTAVSFFKGLKYGTYNFNHLNTAFVPSCILTMPSAGVTSISINSRTNDNTLTGSIWLIGRDGVFLRTQDNVENSIRIDVMGDPMFIKAGFNLDTYNIARPIQTINGMKPNEYGNFNITGVGGDDAIRLVTSPSGIKVYIAGA